MLTQKFQQVVLKQYIANALIVVKGGRLLHMRERGNILAAEIVGGKLAL